MPENSKVRWANRNHTGWWIFREVTEWVPKQHKRLSRRSRSLVSVCTRRIRATGREQAYQKALKLGNAGYPSKTEGGEWRFAGISMLLPVYEKIEDGAEILWDDRRLMTTSTLKRLVKSKHQLPVFNDANHEPRKA